MIRYTDEQWTGTKAWLLERIAEATEELTAEGCTHDHANVLRGRLAAYRLIIETAEPKPMSGKGSAAYT